MKKIIALALILMFVLPLAGCGKGDDSNGKTNDGMQNEWGITLEAENVMPGGLSLVCHQSGGDGVSELQTGSFYVIQRLEEAGWTDVAYAPQEYEVAWTTEAWIIQRENTTTWDVNWEWLYGELPAGEYRIGKEFMNFRGPGDYDNKVLYTDFVIE